MFKTVFPGVIFIALATFALPAAAQTPDGMTPATETMCDPLADATPGLQGLCVAMCEAQDCEASLGPDGEVTFNDSCKASAPKILANYNKIRDRKDDDDDPMMPCVRVVCPCWSEDEIDNIADNFESDDCTVRPAPGPAFLMGNSLETGTLEQAQAFNNKCTLIEKTPLTRRSEDTSPLQSATCRKSLIEECVSRGLYP